MRRIENGDIGGGKAPEMPRAEKALLSAKEVRRRLRVPPDELYLMTAQRHLLSVLRRDEIVYPAVQFSAEGAVLPGVAEVLDNFRVYGAEREMSVLPRDIAEVLSTRSDALEGKTVMEAVAENPTSEAVMGVARDTLLMVEYRNARDFLSRSGIAEGDQTAHVLAVEALHGELGDTNGVDAVVADKLLTENQRNSEANAKYISFTTAPYWLWEEAGVMEDLGIDKRTLEDKIRRHELLALETRDGWVFPSTQFVYDEDTEGLVAPGKARVVPGLSNLLLRLLEDPDSTMDAPRLKFPRWAVAHALHTVTEHPVPPTKRSMMSVLLREQDADFMVEIPEDAYSALASEADRAQLRMPASFNARAEIVDNDSMNLTDADFTALRGELRGASLEHDDIISLLLGRTVRLDRLGNELRLHTGLQVDFPGDPESVVSGDEDSPIAVQNQLDGTHGDRITYIQFKPDRVGGEPWENLPFTPTHAIRIQQRQGAAPEFQWDAVFAARGDDVIVRNISYNGDTVTGMPPNISRELDTAEGAALLNYITHPERYFRAFETVMRLNGEDRERLMSEWRIVPGRQLGANEPIVTFDIAPEEPVVEDGRDQQDGGFTVHSHRSSGAGISVSPESGTTAALAGNGGEYYDDPRDSDSDRGSGRGDSR